MNPSNESSSNSESNLEEAIAEYLDRVDAGTAFEVEAWLARHESIRGELQEFLDTEREFGAAFSPKPPSQPRDLDETWSCQRPLLANRLRTVAYLSVPTAQVIVLKLVPIS